MKNEILMKTITHKQQTGKEKTLSTASASSTLSKFSDSMYSTSTVAFSASGFSDSPTLGGKATELGNNGPFILPTQGLAKLALQSLIFSVKGREFKSFKVLLAIREESRNKSPKNSY